MSWWGKILGGIFGYLIEGPITALIGALLGHTVDSLGNMSSKRAAKSQSRQQKNTSYATEATFFSATFSVMGCVCKADGAVSQEEIKMATNIMDSMDLTKSQREKAIKYFNDGKSAKFPLNRTLERLRDVSLSQKNLLRTFIDVQVTIAFADGDLSTTEKRLLLQIAERLGILRMEYERIEDRIRATMDIQNSRTNKDKSADYAHGDKTLLGAYQTLGIKKDASDRELKKAYRRLLSQHHPDKLVSKDLPAEAMKQATEKTQEIRQSYEIICTSRGI